MSESNITYNSKATRLAEALVEDIKNGIYKPGLPLPKENDLASTYSVSRSTIRRALKMLIGSGELIKEPKRGVWVKAREHNIPTSDFSNQSKGKISIAAVWAAEPDAHLSSIGEGISTYASENNLFFQLFLSREGHREALDVLYHIEEYNVKGIIVFPYENNEYSNAIKSLEKKGIPLVCVDRYPSNVLTHSVEVDNATGFYQLTCHLLEKHERPAIFFGPTLKNKPQKDRYTGYCQAMIDSGFENSLKDNTVLFEGGDADPEFWAVTQKSLPAIDKAKTMLKTISLPASIVCINDYVAKRIYEACNELKLKIGKDVAIASFDDLPLAKNLHPSLTSVRQPRKELGYTTAKLLHNIIKKSPNRKINICLPVELIVRESS